MYFHDIDINSVKEVNDYYARRGGVRTAIRGGCAKAESFSGLIQKATEAQRAAAAARAESAAQDSQVKQSPSQTARTRSALYGSTGQTRSATERSSRWKTGSSSSSNSSDASPQAVASGNSNVCCEQCHATNQLMLQMMSRNLYSQSALGYPLTGYGSWTAYQNMANALSSNLF